jgi:hypothetical protein
MIRSDAGHAKVVHLRPAKPLALYRSAKRVRRPKLRRGRIQLGRNPVLLGVLGV